MVSHPAPSLLLTTDDGVVVSEWTTYPAELHVHDYGFDEYNTEIIALEADYAHRTDIKALDWEETHRQWTGEAWQLDFAALDTAVQHFLDRGYSVTIAASDLSIFLSDYDAPFLEAQLPEEPLPVVEGDTDDDEQTDLSAF
jgi:hypothetical protein